MGPARPNTTRATTRSAGRAASAAAPGTAASTATTDALSPAVAGPPTPGPTPNAHLLLHPLPRITVNTGDYTVVVHESRAAAGLIVPPEEFASVNAFERYYDETADAPYPHFDIFPAWTAALYDVLADKFEFVLFVLANDEKPDALPMNGFTQQVRNDVRGLGIPLFDYSAEFGPDGGSLATIILFTSKRGLRDGPLLHEIAHRWGMNLFDCAWPWHNGFSSVGGQLGGFDTLESLGDGTFRVATAARPDGVFDPVSPGDFGAKNQIPYAPLELYTMGLAPAREVPDVTILADASWVDRAAGVVSGEPRTWTMAEIVRGDLRPEGADLADWGPRDPAWPDAPTAYSALAVYVSSAAVSDPEWTAFLSTVAWAGQAGPDDDPQHNFWEATRGRATLEFGIVGRVHSTRDDL